MKRWILSNIILKVVRWNSLPVQVTSMLVIGLLIYMFFRTYIKYREKLNDNETDKVIVAEKEKTKRRKEEEKTKRLEIIFKGEIADNISAKDKIDSLKNIDEQENRQHRKEEYEQTTLPIMQKEWKPQDCPLYRHLHGSETNSFSERLFDMMKNEMESGNDFSFLSDNPEYQQILEELKGRA